MYTKFTLFTSNHILDFLPLTFRVGEQAKPASVKECVALESFGICPVKGKKIVDKHHPLKLVRRTPATFAPSLPAEKSLIHTTTHKKMPPHNTNFDDLYRKIRLAIYLLEYPPGAALREEELAAEFGVSRTPIRRVLHQLEFEGLVTSQRGVGTVVTTVDIKELKDVYAFRLKLTKLVGELSFPRITEENIAVLEEIKSKVKEKEGSYVPKEMALLYFEFHEEMMTLITNQTLRRVYDELFHQTARVWLQILPELNWTEEVQAFEEEIRDVIKSLKADDIRTMATVRRNHLAMVLHRINHYLGSAYVE